MKMLSRSAFEQFLWQGTFATDQEVSEQQWENAATSVPVSGLPELAARAEKYGWCHTAMACWDRHAAETDEDSSAQNAAWLRSVLAEERKTTRNMLHIIPDDTSARIESFWSSGHPEGTRDLEWFLEIIVIALPRRLGETDADLFQRAQEVVTEYNSKIADLMRR